MVVSFIAVIKGKRADNESKCDHPGLKDIVMNNVDPKERKSGKDQGEQGTMHRTGQRRSYSQSIPVNLRFHDYDKYIAAQLSCKIYFCNISAWPTLASVYLCDRSFL